MVVVLQAELIVLVLALQAVLILALQAELIVLVLALQAALVLEMQAGRRLLQQCSLCDSPSSLPHNLCNAPQER